MKSKLSRGNLQTANVVNVQSVPFLTPSVTTVYSFLHLLVVSNQKIVSLQFKLWSKTQQKKSYNLPLSGAWRSAVLQIFGLNKELKLPEDVASSYYVDYSQ